MFFRPKFLAADFLQSGKIVLRQLPHDGRGGAFVVVGQHVPDARHFLPRDFRVTRLYLTGEVAAGFGNNQDAAFDQQLPPPIGLEGLKRQFSDNVLNPLDSFNDVCQLRNR